MIYLYTGTPGSGKSLHCAEVLYRSLLRGTNVIANFDINLSIFGCKSLKKRRQMGSFLYLDNSDISPQFLFDYAMTFHRYNTNNHIVEGQTVVVIDECQILFNSRDWQARDRMKWATFMSQHRKYGFDIILITQFDRLIDRQIRCLVEYEVVHRNVRNYKTFGFILSLLSGGHLFMAITKYYGLHDKCDSHMFRFKKKYGALYDSYKLFSDTSAGSLARTDDGVPQAGPPSQSEPKAKDERTASSLVTDFKQRILTMMKKFFLALMHFKNLLTKKLHFKLPKLRIKQKQTKTVIPKESQKLPKYESLSEFWNPVPPPN